jgi:serine/threonine-protein kinase
MSAAPATVPRDLVGRRLGRYEVLAQLASGGMATVYAARAQGVAGFERLVAIKVLHPHLAHDDEFISMFLDEARLAARIRHPNVVPTLDISDSQGDGYFLVMEYIEGDHFGSLLREAARAGKNLPPGLSLRVVVDALEGLGAAHSLVGADGQPLGIVHRDISPHNIMVGTDGTTRITDFGVAKAEVRMSSTRDGQFKGKLAYMAPEQAASGHADQRSDLFGMAVVLWESLVGRRLFKAENNAELLNRLLYLPIPPPSEYIPELTPLDALLAKALEREPDKRFQSAPEFIEAIEEAAAGIGGLAPARGVGRAVKEYLGTKIEREAGRIREAMESLGRSEVPNTSVPRPENSSLTPSAQSLVRPKGDSNTGSHRSLPSNDPEASTKLEKLTKQEPIAQPSGGRSSVQRRLVWLRISPCRQAKRTPAYHRSPLRPSWRRLRQPSWCLRARRLLLRQRCPQRRLPRYRKQRLQRRRHLRRRLKRRERKVVIDARGMAPRDPLHRARAPAAQSPRPRRRLLRLPTTTK